MQRSLDCLDAGTVEFCQSCVDQRDLPAFDMATYGLVPKTNYAIW